jgi:hypothetical protein
MDIKENISEYIITKAGKDYVVIFNMINSKEYLSSCEDIYCSMDSGELVLYYINKNNYKTTLIFKGIEKRTQFLMKKSKKFLFIENFVPDEKQNFNYTVRKEPVVSTDIGLGWVGLS